ncbi:MAG: phosphate uptake regulator PhoU [Nitrososphaerota archaeon]
MMEQRKIQRVGKGTLTISLPYWWVREHNLQQGDIIVVEEAHDGSLILWPAQAGSDYVLEACKINADLCDQPGLLHRLIVGSYIAGVDLIEVSSETRLNYRHIKEIREAAKLLTGVSIMDENEQHVILQCMLDALKSPIYSILERICNLASSMQEEYFRAFIEGNRELAKMVMIRDEEVNRLYYLFSRALSIAHKKKGFAEKLGVTRSSEISFLAIAGYCLERMADLSKIGARSVLKILTCEVELDQETLQKLTKYYERCKDVREKAMRALFSRDVKLANEAIRKYFEDLEFGESELVDQLRYKSIKCDVNVLCPNFTQFIWSMKRQAELSAEIAEIIIDMNVKLSRDMVSVGSADLKGLMMAQS